MDWVAEIGNGGIRMKAEPVKNTVEHGKYGGGVFAWGGKRAERHKCQRSAPFAREKPRADWKKELQTCGSGRKSRKGRMLVVGKKSNGKSRFNCSTA
jgi:hypothetical protein